MNSQNIEIGTHYYLQITRCGPNLRNVGRNWDATVDATGTQLGHNWAAAAVARHGHEQCRSPQHGDAHRTASLGRCGAARVHPTRCCNDAAPRDFVIELYLVEQALPRRIQRLHQGLCQRLLLPAGLRPATFVSHALQHFATIGEVWRCFAAARAVLLEAPVDILWLQCCPRPTGPSSHRHYTDCGALDCLLRSTMSSYLVMRWFCIPVRDVKTLIAWWRVPPSRLPPALPLNPPWPPCFNVAGRRAEESLRQHVVRRRIAASAFCSETLSQL